MLEVLSDEIEIRMNTKKNIWSLIISTLLFTLFSVFIFISNEEIALRYRPRFLIFLILYLFFAISFIIKIYRHRPVVLINKEFICWEDGGKGSPGKYLIYWKDIHHFQINFSWQHNKGVDVIVNDPETYLSENWLTKDAQKFKLKQNGTFLTIITDNLECDDDTLIKLLNDYQKKLNK